MAHYPNLRPNWNIETKTLEFKDFSFWQEDTQKLGLEHLSHIQLGSFVRFLVEAFHVTKVAFLLPLLILGCPDYALSPEYEIPLAISGAVAIFLPESQHWKFKHTPPGYLPNDAHSNLRLAYPTLEQSLASLRPGAPPGQDLVLQLAKVFPWCIAITKLGDTLWVEAPKSKGNLKERLEGQAEFRRRILEEPETELNIIEGNTNGNGSAKAELTSSSTMTSVNNLQRTYCSISAGLLVERNGHKRLAFVPAIQKAQRLDPAAVPSDSWKTIGRFGNQIRNSKFVLAELDGNVEFGNRLLNNSEELVSAKKILRSIDHSLGDQCFINTPATGLQMLYRYGKRFEIARERDKDTNETRLSVSRVQGIYLTNKPDKFFLPGGRASFAGALIMRCHPGDCQRPGAVELMKLGQVCGVVTSANSTGTRQLSLRLENYMIFTEDFDDLDADCWKVVNNPSTDREGVNTLSTGQEAKRPRCGCCSLMYPWTPSNNSKAVDSMQFVPSMASLLDQRIIFVLSLLLTLLTPAIANVEKTIFTAPALLPIPLQEPSLANLKLPVLTPDASSIRTNLSRVFPSEPKDYSSGLATWVLLDSLNPSQRYEFRVCWAATQPTGFVLDVYELDTLWATPELVQSLAGYANSRQDQEAELHEESPREGVGERKASLLLLQIKASADYFTDDAALMKDPPPVLVDLILDPYLFNVVPRSLVPTAGYIALVSVVAWFVARSIASRLQTIAVTADSAEKKKS
ncbi:hypothetical protein F66182_7981 [Fusarium sp. NRRL 66182]|nr:hypothetical protein F66182_7981 [Fusarium sp. NRRL 66182]